MSFRVKLRVKVWKVTSPYIHRLGPLGPVVSAPAEPFRQYFPRKIETFSLTFEKPPGVTYMLWNGIDPTNRSGVQ
jgi:hypothetical protein